MGKQHDDWIMVDVDLKKTKKRKKEDEVIVISNTYSTPYTGAIKKVEATSDLKDMGEMLTVHAGAKYEGVSNINGTDFF